MPLTPQLKAQVNDLITRAFAYYDGRINVFNTPVRYFIDFSERKSTNFIGTTELPNLVYIYPAVLARYIDPEKLRFKYMYSILETVIHELFHVDQVIDYVRMSQDKAYKDAIENAADLQTNIYISNNLNEIEKVFNMQINRDELSYFRKMINEYSQPGSWYYRKNMLMQLLGIVKEIFSAERYIDEMLADLQVPRAGIKIVIGDQEFTLMDEEYGWRTIQAFNDFMFDNFYKYNRRNISVGYGITRGNVIIISIENAILKNNMVNLVKGK